MGQGLGDIRRGGLMFYSWMHHCSSGMFDQSVYRQLPTGSDPFACIVIGRQSIFVCLPEHSFDQNCVLPHSCCSCSVLCLKNCLQSKMVLLLRWVHIHSLSVHQGLFIRKDLFATIVKTCSHFHHQTPLCMAESTSLTDMQSLVCHATMRWNSDPGW